MSILSSIGNVLSIWPQTDYQQFVPTTPATVEAWQNRNNLTVEALKNLESIYCAELLLTDKKEA